MLLIKKMFITNEMRPSYKKLFDMIFSDMDIKDTEQNPSIIYIAYDDNRIIGFASGYLHNNIVFYIQYAGMIKECRGYKTLQAFREGLKKINEEYPVITCMIQNINIPAIKLALNENFVINGIRQDSRKKLYIEMIRGEKWEMRD